MNPKLGLDIATNVLIVPRITQADLYLLKQVFHMSAYSLNNCVYTLKSHILQL